MVTEVADLVGIIKDSEILNLLHIRKLNFIETLVHEKNEKSYISLSPSPEDIYPVNYPAGSFAHIEAAAYGDPRCIPKQPTVK